MRADRLLSILLLLQARGRMTAADLSEELEVSVRTIYRDIAALSFAGIPVYTERGPGGGCQLLDAYRTDLTGMSQSEIRALFMLSIPAPLAELGVSQELKGALRKLAAALPAAQRRDQERVRQRIHLDPVDWFQAREPVPHLQIIQHALWQDRRLLITYSLPFDTQVERLVEPYGLVAKASIWYLVCARDDHLQVHRVSEIHDAHMEGASCPRPPDFDLARFWQEWCRDVELRQPHYPVRVRVAPGLIPLLPRNFGSQVQRLIEAAASSDSSGWLNLTLPFETLEDARERILGFGGAMEVLAPWGLRRSIQDYAAQIMALYPS